MPSPVLAVDIGGTKLAAALVGGDGELLRRAERPTPANDGPAQAETVWAALAATVADAVGDEDPAGIGVGCGGPMQWPQGIVSPVYIPAWREFPLASRVAGMFPGRPVRVHNDAVVAAVGEHWRGSGRGLAAFLTVVVSTGVGGGLVCGRVLEGPTGNAGHVGHLVVDPEGPPCGCGGRGCVEAVARGPAIAAWAAANGWTGPEEPTAARLARDAAAGDQVAVAAFARAGRAVGVALAGAAALLDLEAIAVGGGVAGAGEPFLGPLRGTFSRHARLPYLDRCRVVPAVLGRDAGLVGAAALLLAEDTYWSPAGPSAVVRA